MKVHAYQLSEQQIVEHFATMEKKFKRHTGELFFPSLNYTLDLIESGDKLKSLKTEIENMVLFVGLGTMPVKLSVSKLSNAVAVINISNTQCVDITINENAIDANHLDSIMATVAHELSHKVLFMNNIWFYPPMDFENEIYADLATFYLGFGKFTMINYLRKEGNQTVQTGYLTPDTYAMAYVLSEYMNGRKPSTDGLPEHAAKEVKTAILRCSMNWIARIGDEGAAKEMFEYAHQPLGTASLLLNLLERVVEKGRAQIAEKTQELSEFYYPGDKTPIGCRKAQMSARALELGYRPNHPVGGALVESLMDSLLVLMDAGIPGVNDMLTDASQLKQRCPVCGKTISVKEEWVGRSVHTHCPKCLVKGEKKERDIHFVIDNDLKDVYRQLEERRHANEPVSQPLEIEMPRKQNWFKRLIG